MAKAIISTQQLKKSFGREDNLQIIYDNLNLDIYEGDFTIIMGPSGAGKSTLMYSLAGMNKPDSGKIIFDGLDTTPLSSDKLAIFRRKECGFVFQQIYLLEKMSLMDNVLTAGMISNKQQTIIPRAKELFSLVNISEQTQKKLPSQVSGGEAQRAGIVRAIINQPKVLFADEPTGALNSANSQAVLNVFSKLHQKGQTIVMVTHDKQSALYGNRILYLKDGRIFGECRFNTSQSKAERIEKFEAFLAEMGW